MKTRVRLKENERMKMNPRMKGGVSMIKGKREKELLTLAKE